MIGKEVFLMNKVWNIFKTIVTILWHFLPIHEKVVDDVKKKSDCESENEEKEK